MEKLTNEQIVECKILIKRYFELDNKKSSIREKIEEILPPETHERITGYRKTEVIHALDTGGSFIDSVVADEFPYSLENFIDSHSTFLLEDPHIDNCSECGSKDITKTADRSLSYLTGEFLNTTAQYKCNECKWEFGEGEWHDAMVENFGESPDV